MICDENVRTNKPMDEQPQGRTDFVMNGQVTTRPIPYLHLTPRLYQDGFHSELPVT